MSAPEFIVLNGSIIPYEEATTHVMSPAVKYGLSVFEGLRAYWSDEREDLFVFRLQDHTDRLLQSMKLLRFAHDFDGAEINRVTIELLRRNRVKAAAHIRTTAYLDGKGEQQVKGPVSYSISAIEKPRAARTDKGIRCQVSSWMRMADNVMPPRIKCGGNYVNGRLARYQAIQDGYDEAIILNTLGKVAEGPGTCIFLVRRGELITPDLASGILESITRDTALRLARARGIAVAERMVDRTELYAADEVFMVGSAAELVPVVDIDGITIGSGSPGPVTKLLQEAYFAAVTGAIDVPADWLTPVYKSER
ncbi:putative branched-chain-amino-acid aminotransferase [Aliidongia dinghuensis]|uniref:Branched-chain-amino-acid aminotransferase n=1 Tax=Aliidongia dinghuensis TaxID=1867774 RepID=A0A8J3E6X6_9PROT|nr:branched-chain amino acid transaminase [Aliidongia dinghuensis]GGF49181.1 putative branched-chain-amino-acid aminotransferase [Aliidongia dinghuensis]